jgi:PIN domain nuclease of toxin-antitoxin system
MPDADPIVLDTHIWIDVAFGRGRFAPRTLRKLDRAASAGTLHIAAITCWEIAMLARGGKLRVRGPVLGWLEQALELTRTAVVSFEPAIAVDAVELPSWEHADPADRIIVATARHLGATLVTRDAEILEYAETTKAVRALEPS